MSKLLICVCFALFLAAVMLQLREQYLGLNYETARLHSKIESSQARLWSQQLLIGEATAPNAIAAKVKQEHLQLTPESRPQARNWIDPQDVPIAVPASAN